MCVCQTGRDQRALQAGGLGMGERDELGDKVR